MRATLAAAVALTVLGATPAFASSPSGAPDPGKLQHKADTDGTSIAPDAQSGRGSLTEFRAQMQARRGGAPVRGIAAADAPAPAFTAPESGATVAGDVTVSATSTAPSVQFTTTSGDVTVPVVDGVATMTWDAHGTSGAQTISATPCDDLGCGPASSSVDVTVANPAISITAPTAGQVVGTSFVATVAAQGGGVKLLIDGAVVDQSSTAPFDFSVDTAALGDGQHSVSAVQCNTALTQCDGAAAPAVGFRVMTELNPYISVVSPAPFSPNHDGRRDVTTVRYSLDVRQDVTWRVVDGSGATMRGPVKLGSQASGSHEFTWSGKDNGGTPLATGSYRVRLSTSRAVGDETVHGTAERSVKVDVTPARVSDRSASPTTFYPVNDDYKDTVSLRGTINEATSSVKIDVLNSSGSVLRTFDLGDRSAGSRVHATWNGRKSDGSLRSAGTYAYRIRTQDLAGNRATSSKTSFTLSLKKLVGHTVTKTVTPGGSLDDYILGDCSDIWEHPAWSGGYEYLSNFYCDGYDGEDAAATRHRIVLPQAVKYGSIHVDTYGERDVPGYNDTGVVVYEDRFGEFSDYGATLSAGLGWHGGDSVSASKMLQGRSFYWWAGTALGNWYDVKSFRITYRYYVLG